MQTERRHPLLQQTPLTVNPFLDLPKPPTLPPNYATLPSTLPPSVLNTPPSNSQQSSNPGSSQAAYVRSPTGHFAAHPSTIIAQNQALLDKLKSQSEESRKEVEAWENEIKERELQERRRKAPGWLDREERILMPERKMEKDEIGGVGGVKNLMDDDDGAGEEQRREGAKKDVVADDLGEAMDRAFGRSEMG